MDDRFKQFRADLVVPHDPGLASLCDLVFTASVDWTVGPVGVVTSPQRTVHISMRISLIVLETNQSEPCSEVK